MLMDSNEDFKHNMERDVSSGNVGGGGLGNLDEEVAKVTMEETGS
jgi:hypothetical protein